MDEQSVNSKLSRAVEKERRAELTKAEYEFKPLISSKELRHVSLELDEYKLSRIATHADKYRTAEGTIIFNSTNTIWTDGTNKLVDITGVGQYLTPQTYTEKWTFVEGFDNNPTCGGIYSCS